MDEMEIINLHKKCNKRSRKASQPKKASVSPKPDEPKKKVSGLIDDPSEEEKKPKKSDRKKTTKKAGKKVKKTSQPKKAPKSPEFIDSSKGPEVEGLLKMIKRKKCLLCRG